MKPIPQRLKVVAYMFIIGGVFSVIEVIMALSNNRISINFGVLGIFIGMGLMRLRPRAFSWAMFFIWLGLIFTPIVAVLFLFMPGNLNIFGVIAGQASPGLGFIISIAMFALVYWEYTVLTNRQIRRLFV